MMRLEDAYETSVINNLEDVLKKIFKGEIELVSKYDFSEYEEEEFVEEGTSYHFVVMSGTLWDDDYFIDAIVYKTEYNEIECICIDLVNKYGERIDTYQINKDLEFGDRFLRNLEFCFQNCQYYTREKEDYHTVLISDDDVTVDGVERDDLVKFGISSYIADLLWYENKDILLMERSHQQHMIRDCSLGGY